MCLNSHCFGRGHVILTLGNEVVAARFLTLTDLSAFQASFVTNGRTVVRCDMKI